MSSSSSAPAKKSVAFTASTKDSAKSAGSWLHKVTSVQLSQITPEQRAELEEKCRARQDLAKKAKACKGVSMRSKNAVFHTTSVQKSMSAPPPPPASFGAGPGSAPQQQQQQSYTLQASSAMDDMYARDSYWEANTSYQAAPQQRRVMLNDESDDEDGGLSSAMPHLSVAEDVDLALAGRDNAAEEAEIAREEEALKVSADDLDAVLRDLRVEPKDDELMAAKFQIYEKFSEKVTVIRSALEEVAGSALRDLPDGAPREGVRNDLKKLESAEMSGIYDQSRYWFVHDMMQKCAQNCTQMDNMSNKIENLLKFAASNVQTDCPICLRKYATSVEEPVTDTDDEESLPETCTPKTLSCCHSVCTDCWDEWSKIQGSRAFCPLCRNKEFLEYLAQHGQQE